MNDILQNIMVFINEHTLLLIGICVFLILVLIGYLIDNSVKSKRIRKDIKNADQVPENIKDEIIKQAEEKGIVKEDPNYNANNVELDSNINTQPVENTLTMENPIMLGEEKEELPSIEDNSSLDLNIPSELNTELNLDASDPDANIMGGSSDNGYSNDKGLSEILFAVDSEPTNIEMPTVNTEPTKDINQAAINTDITNEDNNIFTNNSSNIVINDNVKKDDVQIEKNDNASDELDRIMRKLSTMNNNVDDDNYTNIF